MTTYDFGDGPVSAHPHPNGGGWVADTAIVEPAAYVGPQAQVYGDARVSAVVCDLARVRGNAIVRDGARICDHAQVFGWAQIGGEAQMCDDAVAYGDATIVDKAVVRDRARVSGYARICGAATILGSARALGDVVVIDNAWTWKLEPEPSKEEAVARLDRIRELVLANSASLRECAWDCYPALAAWAQSVAGSPPDDESAYEDGVRFLGRWGAPMFFASDDDVREWLTERSYS